MSVPDWDRWKNALALTESTNNPHAWGDNGVACGRWQLHPSFFWDWWQDQPHVSDSWDVVFEQALKTFFDTSVYQEPDPVKLAMAFHLHGHVINSAEWDEEYATRFRHFYEGAQ